MRPVRIERPRDPRRSDENAGRESMRILDDVLHKQRRADQPFPARKQPVDQSRRRSPFFSSHACGRGGA